MVKNPPLSPLWLKSLLWPGFNPWPGNFRMPWAQPKKKGSTLKKKSEFPLWLSRLKTQHSLHEDAGLIPGLTQWLNDLAFEELPCYFS